MICHGFSSVPGSLEKRWSFFPTICDRRCQRIGDVGWSLQIWFEKEWCLIWEGFAGGGSVAGGGRKRRGENGWYGCGSLVWVNSKLKMSVVTVPLQSSEPIQPPRLCLHQQQKRKWQQDHVLLSVTKVPMKPAQRYSSRRTHFWLPSRDYFACLRGNTVGESGFVLIRKCLRHLFPRSWIYLHSRKHRQVLQSGTEHVRAVSM